MRGSKAQFGCLSGLLLFVLLGFVVEYFGKHDVPGDDEGGGPIAAIGIVGFVLFFVLFAAIGLVRAVTRRGRATKIELRDDRVSEREGP